MRKFHQPDTKDCVNYLNFYNQFKMSPDNKPNIANFANQIPFQDRVKNSRISIIFKTKKNMLLIIYSKIFTF